MERPVTPTWLFVLIGRGTDSAAWWLKIRSQEELIRYLQQTGSKYGRAFDNYLHDGFYQESITGHGKYNQEANLTLAAYLYGINRNKSMVEALIDLQTDTANRMSEMLDKYGALYINSVGGWNTGTSLGPENGFMHARQLVWPNFTESDIRISCFHGGQHYYAYVGQAQVRDGDRVKFNSYDEARRHALAYLTD